MRKLIVTTLLFTCLTYPFSSATASQVDEIRIRQPQSEFDASHSYYIGLLEIALEKTAHKYGSGRILYKANISQGRELLELARGQLINVAMVGTNIDREKNFIPIRIPLNKGTLGFRVFIIRRDHKAIFDKITTLDELKQLTACQGLSWPDSDIMEAAGLKVIRNSDYESMFRQVDHKRCDFFPRGINEGYSEIKARKESHPNLMLYDRLVLSYTFPMYFFVSPKYPKLAKRLTEGLKIAIADGTFEQHIRSHEVTQSLFPIQKWAKSLELKIENPFLSKQTPLDEKKLWLKLPFLQATQ